MHEETMLGDYRVLDLTEGGCLISGQIFGDLGADVIKIEPPGGSSSRNIGPFFRDLPDPEKSLFWFAYNRNKRGITLDLTKRDGRELFGEMVKRADIVLESFPPGYLDSLGIGYAALCKIKPEIILTSITPFGTEGPKSEYKSSDLTTWAASVILSIAGDPDRAPTWISWPCAGIHGGIQGTFASLFALWNLEVHGEGQHVDAPIQQYVMQHTTGTYWWWECIPFNLTRMGPYLRTKNTSSRMIHPCKDGYIHCIIGGGAAAGIADSTTRWVNWMKEEGMAPDWMTDFDWFSDYDSSNITQEEIDRIVEPFQQFLLNKTKAEITEQAVRRGIIACAVANTGDICSDEHLDAREFWQEVEHPELGESLTYCGPFLKFSEAPMNISRRAPLIGEHNIEIYEGELGLSREGIVQLAQSGVI